VLVVAVPRPIATEKSSLRRAFRIIFRPSEESRGVLCDGTIGGGELEGIGRASSRRVIFWPTDTSDVCRGESYTGEETCDECETHGEDRGRTRLYVLQYNVFIAAFIYSRHAALNE
jgi:hypothetical protein